MEKNIGIYGPGRMKEIKAMPNKSLEPTREWLATFYGYGGRGSIQTLGVVPY